MLVENKKGLRRRDALGLCLAAGLAGCQTTPKPPPAAQAPRAPATRVPGGPPGTPAPAPPPLPPLRPPRIGLALGGGAARGFAHIGVIQALEESAIRPDLV